MCVIHFFFFELLLIFKLLLICRTIQYCLALFCIDWSFALAFACIFDRIFSWYIRHISSCKLHLLLYLIQWNWMTHTFICESYRQEYELKLLCRNVHCKNGNTRYSWISIKLNLLGKICSQFNMAMCGCRWAAANSANKSPTNFTEKNKLIAINWVNEHEIFVEI